MIETLITQSKSHNPEILEIVDVDVDEGLVFALVEKEKGKKSTVVVYEVKNNYVKEHTVVTAYWVNDKVMLDVTEDGSTRTVQTDYTKQTDDVAVQASVCENAINILCGIGGVAACRAACRAIPVIGVLLGFTICRNLCGSIVGDGCNAAKNRFC